jgi:hypothetical protein
MSLAEPSIETKFVRAATQRGSDVRVRCGAARAAQIKLLASTPQTWPWLLSRMQEPVLECLRDMLKGKKILVASEPEKKSKSKQGKSKSSHSLAGMIQNKSGYKIEVTWSSFCVSTGFTKSISQAIDWQIILSRTRSKAQARMKQDAALGPLTGEELLQVLQEEPSMDLTFYTAVQVGGKKSKKVTSPAISDLNMAKDFYKRLLSLVHASKPESVLQKEKQRIDKEAHEGRRLRRLCENQLAVAVSYELRLRAARSAGAVFTEKKAGSQRKRKHDPHWESEETSLVVYKAENFKPHRRISGKTPITVLAIARQDEIGYMHEH